MLGVRPEHQTAEYWIARQAEYGPLDELLMSPEAIRRHNLALRRAGDGEPLGRADLFAPIEREELRRQLEERLSYVRRKVKAGDLLDENADRLRGAALEAFTVPDALDMETEWRAVEALTPVRCAPHDGGLYTAPIDRDFDRNRCSTARPGELLQLVAPWGNGMFLARTSYTLGWVSDESLSSALDREAARAASQRHDVLPLTRRALLTEAFSMRGEPYGWGGKDGGYDCSRYLLEIFERFGIELPRHSGRQALAGTFSLDVSKLEDLNEKRLLLEAASRRGIVLMHFPGHIMLYLGTTDEGVPMAIHAFSEFLTSCEGTDLETVNRVDRVAVSDLSLGENTSRRDFLSRTTRITVLGHSPGRALVADAQMRPTAPAALPEGRCTDSKRISLFRSPLRPDNSRPLRVIVTSEPDPGAASLVLFAPDGTRWEPEQHRLDGPPFGRWVEVLEPIAGRWTAILADGDDVRACERIGVAARPSGPEIREVPGPAWEVGAEWGRPMENLYSAFIEQLFLEPADDDMTWPRLQALIADPERNLLYDYRAPGEDAELGLEPDCADLPYFLRAYFAWKLRLPFVYRACTRGRRDEPPRCEPAVLSNLDSVPDKGAPDAFRRFARRMASTVHSSSPRTLPADDETDFYPVPLRRQSLRPGTIYADPHGHVLVAARWKPQGVTDYGTLIAADAQPDGTVGRRRFWRGSFLFTPDTELVGAGFKAWRPVRIDASDGPHSEPGGDAPPWEIAANDELRTARGAQPWSDMQYRGTADEFYSAVEAIINPRPLDPVRMQLSLADALDESVQRRLSSVENGEEYMREQGYAVIDMPHGSALFLTTGAWEDFSTPSRDMRLLISIDAVVSFPDTVATYPERFGLIPSEATSAVGAVRDALAAELERRSFEYTRSDGSTWKLTLADVVERIEALEVAYNPNDCVEIRWGAAEGSEERATCQRRAPSEQQTRMQKYRAWFAKRERPG